MKKVLFITTVLFCMLFGKINAQSVYNFEDLTVPSQGYWNGSDASGLFGNSQISFVNNYDATSSSWYGFAYSTMTDVTTPGFGNQYSTFSGSAHSGTKFGVAYVGSDWMNNYATIPSVCNFLGNMVNPQSIFVTNATYAALEIQNGTNPFAAGDWFKIIIEGKNQNISTGTVEYYLADFRNGLTFVENTWHEINLTTLGTVDKLEFYLESSDVGAYGINTPTYFCFDDLTYTTFSNILITESSEIDVFPNPFSNKINIKNSKNSDISIYSVTGLIIKELSNINSEQEIDLSDLKSGIYFVKIKTDNSVIVKKIIKKI